MIEEYKRWMEASDVIPMLGLIASQGAARRPLKSPGGTDHSLAQR
jgi:hypothetical protein